MREKRMREHISLSDRVVAVLAEHGVRDVPEAEIVELADHLYGELEYTVGVKLSAGLSEAQMLEFQHYIDTGNDEGSNAFLQRTVPDYREVTERALEQTVERLRTALTARYARGTR